MVEIEIAKYSGFCYGVKRALEIANANPKSFTLGPLIHNPHVISDLEKMRIFARTFDELKKERRGKVIIRAHGGIKKEIDYLINNGFQIIDATCPNVEKVREYALKLKKEGYDIFIFGDKGHAEIKSFLSYVPAKVISSPEEIDGFSGKKIGLVAQTTQDVKIFDDIVGILKERCSDFKYHKTICPATHNQQECAKDLAGKVDAMLVIGGKNSANTKRLYDICLGIGNKTYWIEDSKDLDKNRLLNINKIGITAGASTPDYVIEGVKNKIELLYKT